MIDPLRPQARRLGAAALVALIAIGAYVLGVTRVASDTARATPAATAAGDLWATYAHVLSRARYISLSHTIAPRIPVWKGFGPSTFSRAVDPATGRPYTYAKDGVEATHYDLATDQLGTQLDPPAHWDPHRPAIDELPATFGAPRPLVVISIVPQARRRADYHLQVADIRAWEAKHGRIPAGSVVMVRSDWSREWPGPELAEREKFPGVSVAALRFLHLERRILLHGHEPLDTDTTPTLVGEAWLMHHGYTQAEGVAHLDRVPPRGCLVSPGFPRFRGGTGGYASFTAICPPSWRHGRRVSRADAPLPRFACPLHWSTRTGTRVR
ncbi:MAG TPA: cyclase family protein [Thermoleophilaceae bacterium]|jgi:kynurenine formamidase